MNIFPEQHLTQTEMDIVAEKLSDPSVKNYLHQLAYKVGVHLATGSPMEGQSDNDFLRRRATLQGHLEVIDTLLSIQVAE